MSDPRLLTKERLKNIRISVLISGGPLALELLNHIEAQAELNVEMLAALKRQAQGLHNLIEFNLIPIIAKGEGR